MVRPNEGETDPVPVVQRTIQKAKAENYDVCIIDTSGRLSNNFELIQQLQDMKAIIEKELPDNGAPHETLLVVDGSVGRNAVDQATAWRKYVGVSGLVITKLDGTARGGFVVSVVKDQGLPVKFIGVGEKIDDLRDFEPSTFVDALLGTDINQLSSLRARAGVIIGSSDDEDVNSDSGGGGDGVSRLKAKLNSGSSDGSGGGDGGMTLTMGTNAGGSANGSANGGSKRKARPKPQQSKKKMKKKK